MANRVIALSVLLVVLCAPVTSAQTEYRVDDGTGDINVGFDAPTYASHAIGWINRFRSELHTPIINTVRVAFGTILTGKEVRLYVWVAGPSGSPIGSVIVSTGVGVVANAGTNAFNDFPISPVVTHPGQMFFVGAIIDDYPSGSFPARMDTGNAIYPPNEHSFLVGNVSGALSHINADNLADPLMTHPVDTVVHYLGGTDGNFMVRASAGPQLGACCAPGGGCAMVDFTTCSAVGWSYLGDGTTCTPNPCPQSGGCPPPFEWELAAGGGSPGRMDHAMAYDPVRQRVVAFGGSTQTGVSDETLEWNGMSWALGPVTTPPPEGRKDHAMATDPDLGVVMFGGRDLHGAYPNDTWRWDGAVWTQVASGGPAARHKPGDGV